MGTIADLPNPIRPVVKGVLHLAGEQRKCHMFSMARNGGLTVREFWELVADVEAFRNKYIAFLRDGGFDILLLPGVALPALLHGQSKDLNQCCTYTFLANLLGWPAGICPVTQVKDEEQCYPLEKLPTCQRDSLAHAAARIMVGSAGLPVGVQLF